MAGIYLHIPFCSQACHYCDFYFSTNTSIKTELILAMGEEIRLQKNYLQGEVLNSIYFGGGTPSLLNKKELGYLLEMIHRTHLVSGTAELTLEANPDNLIPQSLSDFKSLGINRLSIGIQSFDDAVLKYLNRLHDADTAKRSVQAARAMGFKNISIDLMYAIPGLTNPRWQENISQAVELDPEHISAYTLTIEEKTTFGNWLAKGKLKPVGETLAARQFEILVGDLKTAGYGQYEISNFSRPGFQSKHNSSYWKGIPYLGIGPSAHSYNKTTRQFNVKNNHQYIRSLHHKTIPCETEILTKNDHINEYILTTLRTDQGCNVEKLKLDFNYDLLELHAAYLRQLQSCNLITFKNKFLILTEGGRLLADKISADLFLIS